MNARHLKTVLLPLFLGMLAFAAAGCHWTDPKPPRAVRGVIDLRGWSFKSNGPADLSGAPATEADQELARYWAQAGDWDKSLAAARNAAAKDPKSIEAQSLAGDALSAKKDLDGAMTAYQAALKLFNESEEAKDYEPPDYLLRRISRIAREKASKDSASGAEKTDPD